MRTVKVGSNVPPTLPTQAKYCNGGELPATLKIALGHAGKEGSIATLPDIVQALLGLPFDASLWRTTVTTMSAEYFGKDANGQWQIVIAHGIGPLMDTARLAHYCDEAKAYVTDEEFNKLLDGEYGPVTIVPAARLSELYEYPLMGPMAYEQALQDPLLLARLGPQAVELVTYYFTTRVAGEEAHDPGRVSQETGSTDNVAETKTATRYVGPRSWPAGSIDMVRGDCSQPFGQLLVMDCILTDCPVYTRPQPLTTSHLAWQDPATLVAVPSGCTVQSVLQQNVPL